MEIVFIIKMNQHKFVHDVRNGVIWEDFWEFEISPHTHRTTHLQPTRLRMKNMPHMRNIKIVTENMAS